MSIAWLYEIQINETCITRENFHFVLPLEYKCPFLHFSSMEKVSFTKWNDYYAMNMEGIYHCIIPQSVNEVRICVGMWNHVTSPSIHLNYNVKNLCKSCIEEKNT